MIFETHAHYDDAKFDTDREMLLAELPQREQMRDMYRSEALNNVKTELVIDEIIKAENIEATDEDVNKLLESYTTAMNQTVEQLRESFSEEQLDFFKHRASMNKALDLLWDNAKVTDEDADAKPEAKAGDGEAAAPAEA